MRTLVLIAGILFLCVAVGMGLCIKEKFLETDEGFLNNLYYPPESEKRETPGYFPDVNLPSGLVIVADSNEPNDSWIYLTDLDADYTIMISLDAGSVEYYINDEDQFDIRYEGDVNEPAMLLFNEYLKDMCDTWIRNNCLKGEN